MFRVDPFEISNMRVIEFTEDEANDAIERMYRAGMRAEKHILDNGNYTVKMLGKVDNE